MEKTPLILAESNGQAVYKPAMIGSIAISTKLYRVRLDLIGIFMFTQI